MQLLILTGSFACAMAFHNIDVALLLRDGA